MYSRHINEQVNIFRNYLNLNCKQYLGLTVRNFISGANLLAVNADGNMPYDICEDEEALDYIENEMARRGVTQELIDETRGSTEMRMLRDLQLAVVQGHDLECKDEQNATPVIGFFLKDFLYITIFLRYYA